MPSTLPALFYTPVRYSALSIAYAVAAALSGLVPVATQSLAIATESAWWHPGIVLAILSVITLVAAIVASRWTKPVDELD